MSVSPQPHPQHPALSRSPPDVPINSTAVLSLSHATNPPTDSPAQLASLLSDALHEVETLKRDLATQKRRADKAERLLANYQQVSTGNGSPSAPAPGSTNSPSAQIDEAAARLILECEARVERAELERHDMEARMQRIQAQWMEDERTLFEAESKIAEIRASFSQVIVHRGGQLVVLNGQPHPGAQIAGVRAGGDGRSSRHGLSVRTSGTSSRSGMPLSAQPHSSATPQNSRVRPRAGSLDGSYANLTGPGGPPPAKRARNDRDRHHERDLQVPQGHAYSQSVSVDD